MENRHKHILVPLNETKAAEVALDDALALARAFEADVTLIEVVQPIGEVVKTGRREVCIDPYWPARIRRAVYYLDSVAKRPDWQDIPVRVEVETGAPTETVARYARSHAIDFIVWPAASLEGEKDLELLDVGSELLEKDRPLPLTIPTHNTGG
jgi:nucleotide-binding universal stress UspA family protein